MTERPHTPDPNLKPDDTEELDSTILLADEDGNEYAYDIADYIDVDDKEYVVLVPQDDADDEVVILRVEDGDEDEDIEYFVDEEDETILDKVFEIFKARFADEYNFVDGEDDDALFTDAT